MAVKYNININGIRPFQVKVRIVTENGKTDDREIQVEAKTAKAAGYEAERILRNRPNIKHARWLYAIDTQDGTIHY